MNISFDFDGFIVEDTEVVYVAISKLPLRNKQKEKLQDYEIINNSKPLYNPLDFTKDYGNGDRAYCISYCERETTLEHKRSWLYHYFRDSITFIGITEKQLDQDLVAKIGLRYAIAQAKVNKVMGNNIEVHFDSIPQVVDYMREMLPNYVKVIKCGRNIV